ncbi:hypothetical protein PHK61_25820 [Actinomycetospora lutea]|uniref:hypothetical protein n=1 Tax=Actinomycetospora lutea TaxID=663604 RepID=UPI002365BB65|nr:hypothetical protein [Actinomycetospora lutea]MDD7941841.1 hypothetical protein [Actinomycetospora lutea]
MTRAQLRARGYTDHGIQAQIDAGRWQRLHDGVYLTYSGPPTPDALRSGALLACPSGGMLSHETAAELHGFVEPNPRRPVHVTVRYGCSAVRLDGVKVHRSRAFAHIGVVGSDPPRTSRAHTVLDLAVAAPDAQEALHRAHHHALEAGVHPLALESAVELRRPARHRRAIAAAVALLRDGVLSELEYRYLVDVEQGHGLPVGHRQAPVLVDGVRRYEDILYDMPDGRVIVRLDGFGTHRDARTALVDRRRSVTAAVAGEPSVPFGWEEVTAFPCRTAREVAALLRTAGWDGAVGPCGLCERNSRL